MDGSKPTERLEKTDGVLKYYNNSGAPAQGWTEIDEKDYFFVDGVSQAGWVETDAGTRYLDGNGNQMTGWCVIDGQPYAFGTNGEPKQGWDHSHEKATILSTASVSRAHSGRAHLAAT